MRRLAVELRPSALDDFGLVPAVERLTDTFREQSGLQVDLESQLGDERLATEAETTLYRVIQEALTNVIKHAGAERVSILLQRKDGAVVAVVEDDGSGFDPAPLARTPSGSPGCASASLSPAGGCRSSRRPAPARRSWPRCPSS